jgi:hypothetical protein
MSNSYDVYTMLKFSDALTKQEFIGAAQGILHPDSETIDGSGTTTESTTP